MNKHLFKEFASKRSRPVAARQNTPLKQQQGKNDSLRAGSSTNYIPPHQNKPQPYKISLSKNDEKTMDVMTQMLGYDEDTAVEAYMKSLATKKHEKDSTDDGTYAFLTKFFKLIKNHHFFIHKEKLKSAHSFRRWHL